MSNVRQLTYLVVSCAVLALAACSGGGNVVPGAVAQGGSLGSQSSASRGVAALPAAATTSSGAMQPAPTAPPDAPGDVNIVPTLPPAGHSRTGLVYSVYVRAATGDTIAFTVFELHTLTGGKAYPLILQGHRWRGSRVTNLNTPESLGDIGNIPQFVANNYGVISLGESTGKIRSMDPNFEGKDVSPS